MSTLFRTLLVLGLPATVLLGGAQSSVDWRAAEAQAPALATILAAAPPRVAASAQAAELRRIAEEGLAEAETRMGSICYLGEGVAQDLGQARSWFGKAAAQGDPEAQAKLGAMCYMGEGGPRDPVEALRWLSLSAAQDNAYAQGCLGLMYAVGDGVARDGVTACALLLRAVAGGNEQAGKSLRLLQRELTPAQVEEGRRRALSAESD